MPKLHAKITKNPKTNLMAGLGGSAPAKKISKSCRNYGEDSMIKLKPKWKN